MGVFNNYAIVPADKFMPIDVHVPGCPPRPEALMHGVLRLRDMIQDKEERAGATATARVGTEEVAPPPEDPAVDALRQASQHSEATKRA